MPMKLRARLLYLTCCISIHHHKMQNPRTGAWRPSDGLLAALRDDLCRMLDMDFPESSSLLKKSVSEQSVVRNTQEPRPKHSKTVDLNL
jgi:hypothetical protein